MPAAHDPTASPALPPLNRGGFRWGCSATAAPASLESVLSGLNDEAASGLLAFFRECCDSEGLIAPPLPGQAEVQLSWPHRGQYCVQTPSGHRFIHPDAAGVLQREFDRFLIDRYLPLDDLNDLENRLARVHALRAAGRQLIELIAQAQELQKRAWLRKKLILEAHYCFTLDLVPREFYPEIAANDAQREQWVRLYHIDEIESSQRPAGTPDATEPGYSRPLTVAFLEAHPFLMLDTRFFERAFVDRLLASFDDLDETLDGLLIPADNFHALSLLEPRYRNAIDCIYTDPPYNTGGADLPYHDRYASSHWLTMMENRFRIAHRLLKPGGPCFVSIDENEQARLELLLNEIFSPGDFVATFVWEAGRKNDSRLVSVSHEYMLCYVKDRNGPAGKGLTWRVRKEGIDAIHSKARSLVRQCKGDYRQASLRLRQWLNGLPDNHPARRHRHYHCIDARGVYHPGNISWPGGGGPRYEVLHPVTGRPCKVPSRGWMYPTPERMAEAIRDGLVHFGEDETRVPCAKVYLKGNEHQAPNSVFYRDGRAAMKRLRHILGEDGFCNPKDELLIADRIRFSCPRGAGISGGAGISRPPAISRRTGAPRGAGILPALRNSQAPPTGADITVLDFFAGSGSTAHAVIHLNRSDHGRRRYILVESSDAFDAVLRTRIQRVVYATKWKHGRPLARDGIRHAFKYLRLEPCEDAVSTPDAPPAQPPVQRFRAAGSRPASRPALRPGDAPSRDGQQDIHSLEKAPADEGSWTPAHVETFNYLLGLHVRRMRTDEASGIRWVEGITPAGERVLVVWRKPGRNPMAGGENLAAWLERRQKEGVQFDVIYTNAANELQTRRGADEHWEIRSIEESFERLMSGRAEA